jgi:DNA-binding NtrC family response regulator
MPTDTNQEAEDPTVSHSENADFAGMVGVSAAMRKGFELVRLFAPSPANLLITGESGTGKELVARALHDNSDRAGGPYVTLNCAAVPKFRQESDLLGHEPGAFTDAKKLHIGKFERADHGTLFLDEIGDMDLGVQAAILRVVEDKKIERVGGEEAKGVDVRIIAATNQDLEEMVRKGTFRQDLYYRLNKLIIHLPPLRERGEDIGLLLDYFLALSARQYGRFGLRFSEEAHQALLAYSYPGNVRELMSIIESAVLIETADAIRVSSLPSGVLRPPAEPPRSADQIVPFKEAFNGFERQYLVRVLAVAGGNISEAARLAKMNRSVMDGKLRDHGIKGTRKSD